MLLIKEDRRALLYSIVSTMLVGGLAVGPIAMPFSGLISNQQNNWNLPSHINYKKEKRLNIKVWLDSVRGNPLLNLGRSHSYDKFVWIKSKITIFTLYYNKGKKERKATSTIIIKKEKKE